MTKLIFIEGLRVSGLRESLIPTVNKRTSMIMRFVGLVLNFHPF
jgi:hypothetical protein